MAPSVNRNKSGANTGASNKTVKSGRVTKQPLRDWSKYTHIPPNADQISSNGRQTGRNLITWNRPHMAEKLLLHMEYELVRHRVNVPWNSISHRLNPGSSGAAVTQYLHRLRLNMLAQGHMVPPIPMKPGGPTQDPAIRGYVRKDMHSGDPTTTRPVPWTEPMYDLKTPLSDSAWALDALDTQEDSGFQEKQDKSRPKAKKAVRLARAAAQKVTYNEDDSGDVSEDAEDEADSVEDEEMENQDELDGEASQLSHGASKPKGFKAGRTHGKDTGAVDTPFGTVTPKRCGGNSNIPFQDMLNGAVLYTPDGRQYGFTDMADLNVGISTQPFLTAVPSPTSGSFFTTAVSSPGNWDLANATPTTRANMFAHLNEWNASHSFLSFQSIMNAPGSVTNANADQNLLAITAGGSHGTQWGVDNEIPSTLVSPKDISKGLDNVQKHK